MRKIGTIEDKAAARAFVDYLASQPIAADLRDGSDGFAVWVIAERDVEAARVALEQFQADPTAERYQRAAGQAKQQREAGRAVERSRRKRDRAANRRWAARGENTLTFVLMAASVLISLTCDFGRGVTDPVAPQAVWWLLAVDQHTEFPAKILSGQVWRLLTPIFVHFDWAHLIFNLYALLYLGSMIEMRRGWRYLGLLVLVMALISNVAQGLWYPYFGGISGVVYGLFGFVWMRMRHQGNEGYYLDRSNIYLLLGWMIFCLAGFLPIANAGHVSGFLTGVVLGAGPFWWRRIRDRGGKRSRR